ncbi:MAG: MarR family transcriptional regulator [Ignavibacteriales bacterium]|nr:MarR family transcriptional regulator [Ignavibacteriales bacterium]
MEKVQKYGKEADLALNLWVKLARASATFGKLSAVNIKTFGLTEPQFAVLECLGHKGPLKLSVLSKKMLMSGGNTTCVVDNLEKQNLVERTQSKEDRRAIIVQLTPESKKLFDEIFIKHAEFITKIAGVLTEKEQGTLARLLKKLGLSLKDLRSN